MTWERRWVRCVDNGDHVDLVVGEIYRVIPDNDAESVDSLRVVDETDESFLYPSRCFTPVSRAIQLVGREGVLRELLDNYAFPTENHRKIIELTYKETLMEMHEIGLVEEGNDDDSIE